MITVTGPDEFGLALIQKEEAPAILSVPAMDRNETLNFTVLIVGRKHSSSTTKGEQEQDAVEEPCSGVFSAPSCS